MQYNCTIALIKSGSHLHPIVLFQRNEILPKVCYICFLLSATGIFLKFFSSSKKNPPVEMRKDFTQLTELFPKLLILPLKHSS